MNWGGRWLAVLCVSLAMGLALCGPALAADLREGVEQLAGLIMRSVPEGRVLRVAVTDFPDLQGVTSDLGRYIAERLTTRLAQSPRFRVTERRRLAQVLGELKFGMSDLVDPAKAKQLGRLAGVEVLAVGSLSDLGNTVEVDARIIEIETGNMLVATNVAITKDETARSMLERGREIPLSGGTVSVSGGPAAGPARTLGTVKYQELRKLRVEIEGLTVRNDGSVEVVLGYVNKTNIILKIALFDGRAGLSDDAGNEYWLYTQGLADRIPGRTDFESWLNVEPGERGSARFVFRVNPVSGAQRKSGRVFSFTGTHVLHDSESSVFSVSIRNIEPR